MKRDLQAAVRENLAAHTASRHYALERFMAEAAFARGLAELHGRQDRWGKLVDQASRVVEAAIAAGKLDGIETTVRQAEEILAPIGEVAKTYTLHCVGHGHIDLNWMWSWAETVAVANDTFTTVLKLMDEFPDFCFTQSQAAIYDAIREHNLPLFERIRGKIAEGRWEVAAAHWVEGDKNMASGEGLARQMLYARRFVQKHFGLSPEDLPLEWEPDTFGHARSVPTIVSRGAVRWYYLNRGGDFEKPPLFWWRGPDGSKILVNRETVGYNDHIGPHNAQGLLAFAAKTGLRDWLRTFGIGDHGGGPTRRDLLRARDMNGWPIYPNFRFGTTRGYFEIAEKQGDKLPVLEGELNFEFTGCYSSQARIKRANRLGEIACQEAETTAALAHRTVGMTYPHERLQRAWTDTLFGHFHDILPGSCTPVARDYQMGLFQKTTAATGMIKSESLRGLAAAVDTSFAAGSDPPTPWPPDRQSIAMGGGAGRGSGVGEVSAVGRVADGARVSVAFNPLAWDRREIATATVWDPSPTADLEEVKKKTFVARTPDGKVWPAQQLDVGTYWRHQYVELAFPLEVGATGYAAFSVEEGEAPRPRQGTRCGLRVVGKECQPAGECVLESDLLFVRFDPASAGIISLIDKTTGVDVADPAHPLAIFEHVLERPHGMSSWLLGDTQRRITLEAQQLVAGTKLPYQPHLISHEQGPYAASMIASYKLNDSIITAIYTLRTGQPWLEIALSVNWLERGGPEVGVHQLRVQFPLPLTGVRARYEIPYGSIERPQRRGEEVPALRWADVTGKLPGGKKTVGLTLLNDCTHGHSLENSTLRLTLLRSTYNPDPLPDLGQHTIRLGLVPHAGMTSVADLVRLGAAFSQPLHVVGTDVHKGKLPSSLGGVERVRPDNVLISAIRKAEDDDGLIVRLYETDGIGADAMVVLEPRRGGKVISAVETDLLERPLAKSTARVVRNGFRVRLPGHGIGTVKVGFKN